MVRSCQTLDTDQDQARSNSACDSSLSSGLRELHKRVVRYLTTPGKIIDDNEDSTSLLGFFPILARETRGPSTERVSRLSRTISSTKRALFDHFRGGERCRLRRTNTQSRWRSCQRILCGSGSPSWTMPASPRRRPFIGRTFKRGPRLVWDSPKASWPSIPAGIYTRPQG